MSLGMGIGIGIGSRASSAGNQRLPMLYRLIDGPFFYSMCTEACLIDGHSDFKLDLNALSGAYRTIYYDALPVQKDAESEADFQSKLSRKVDFLNSIRNQRDMQVRDGLTRLKTPERGKAASQILEQKGVDTWIAVDAVKLALTGAADQIEIFTSDSDIYPAFDVIRETSAKSVLRYQAGRAIQELIYSADWARPFVISEVLQMAGKAAANVTSMGGSINFETVIEITKNDHSISFGRGGDDFVANVVDLKGNPSCLRSNRFSSMIDFLNGFGQPKSWSVVAKELAALRN